MPFKKIFVLLTLINLSFPLVPIWNVETNALSFFLTDNPNYREIEVYNYHNYTLKKVEQFLRHTN